MTSGPEPSTAAPRSAWTWGDRGQLAVRLLLLLVLAAGAVSAAGALHRPQRQEGDLLADLAAGRVTYVVYERTTREVSWADGWWSWSRGHLDTWERAEDDPSGTREPGAAAEDWLYRRVAASPRPPAVEIRGNQTSEPTGWRHLVAWPPLRTAVLVAWWLAFLMMLARRDHRYANRWAWFWMFTVGQVGAVLHLLLEPRPLWWSPSTAAARTATGRVPVPVRGGGGCAWALLLAMLVALAAALTGAALTAVL